MINTRAEAAALVSTMRYPPLGTRSFGPTRVNLAAYLRFCFATTRWQTLARDGRDATTTVGAFRIAR